MARSCGPDVDSPTLGYSIDAEKGKGEKREKEKVEFVCSDLYEPYRGHHSHLLQISISDDIKAFYDVKEAFMALDDIDKKSAAEQNSTK